MERFEHGGRGFAHPGCVDFSANLNPLGMPSPAREALVESVDAFARYPDPQSSELVRAIAAFEGVPASWVAACAGASDAFARICAVVRPREGLVCAPCYSGYELALEQVGARVAYASLDAARDFEPTRAIAAAIGPSCDLVFVANPNNPTGRCVPRGVLEACLSRAREVGAFVVVDECFIDLTAKAGSRDLLQDHPHLVLVKALTKSFCLAGLRVGYAVVSDEGLAQRLREAGQPWAVSVPAQVAGVACLAEAEEYLLQSRELVARERARLACALRSKGLRVLEGEANYLLFFSPAPLYDALLERGVLVRPCDNFCGLDARWHRIAVRTPEENDRLIQALEEVMR